MHTLSRSHYSYYSGPEIYECEELKGIYPVVGNHVVELDKLTVLTRMMQSQSLRCSLSTFLVVIYLIGECKLVRHVDQLIGHPWNSRNVDLREGEL